MNRVAVITGAAGAMGSTCARTLGHTVDELLLTDCDEAGLIAVAEQLASDTGAVVTTIVGDVGDARLATELAARVADLGEFHSLVHTAGVSPSMAGWRDILRTDLIGVERLLGVLAERVVPGTAAVCLASIAGLLGTFDPAMDAVLDRPLQSDFCELFGAHFSEEPDPGATYRLAKRGVIRSCERAAVTWAARGGRVNSLSPGLIDTPMGRLELTQNPVKEEMARLTPIRSARQTPDLPLPGNVADIAATVKFLCSEEAAFISGCDLRVDGGFIAAMTHRNGPASSESDNHRRN
jgi:NAD(P)-dependent dehydrogenase (short-subunit alcohol dehydrogenase family)